MKTGGWIARLVALIALMTPPAIAIGQTQSPTPTLLTETQELYFQETFDPGRLSERLWYNAQWSASEGILTRLPGDDANTRIFLRDAKYRDCLIQFDFRMGQAKDVRLMTGSGGQYNTVLHLRPDHFFLQTAMDASVPYFSYRHSECAFDFQPDTWYTMTIEFAGDEAIAYIDHDHLVRANHPIIDRRREYFAIQVDQHVADFDNVAILHATKKNSTKTNAGRRIIDEATNKYPVEKSLEENFKICSSNAHEWYYQHDERYRSLVLQVEALDQGLKAHYPAVFRSHKEYQKAIQEQRKQLLKNDAVYKETLLATHRTNRAIDDWILLQHPELKSLPFSRKKAGIERSRREFADNDEFQQLTAAAHAAQEKLQHDYPQLFVTNQQITQKKNAARKKLKSDKVFQQRNQQRADAYNAQRAYLLKTDASLRQLQERIVKAKASNTQ